MTKIMSWTKPQSGLRVEIPIEAVLFDETTNFQRVEIVKTRPYGLALFLDGHPQTFDVDQSLYHTALAQPALHIHPNPERVLIIGCAEGATLREVTKHKRVKSITMVDIDKQLVQACMTYTADWHMGSFNDPRLELIYEDATAWLQHKLTRQFDVVIIALGDPLEPGLSGSCFGQVFFQLVQRALANDGLLVSQIGELDPQFPHTTIAIKAAISDVFPSLRIYSTGIPSYCAEWGFVLATSGQSDLITPALCPNELNGYGQSYHDALLKWPPWHKYPNVFSALETI